MYLYSFQVCILSSVFNDVLFVREPKAFGFKCDQPKDYCDRLCDYGLKKAVRLVKLDPTKSLRCPTCHCDKTPILADYLKELEAIEQETGKKQIREIDEPGEDY